MNDQNVINWLESPEGTRWVTRTFKQVRDVAYHGVCGLARLKADYHADSDTCILCRSYDEDVMRDWRMILDENRVTCLEDYGVEWDPAADPVKV